MQKRQLKRQFLKRVGLTAVIFGMAFFPALPSLAEEMTALTTTTETTQPTTTVSTTDTTTTTSTTTTDTTTTGSLEPSPTLTQTITPTEGLAAGDRVQVTPEGELMVGGFTPKSTVTFSTLIDGKKYEEKVTVDEKGNATWILPRPIRTSDVTVKVRGAPSGVTTSLHYDSVFGWSEIKNQ